MLCKLLFRKLSVTNLLRNSRTFLPSSPHSAFSVTAQRQSSNADRKLDEETIKLLEKLSLVNFEDRKYVTVVEEAIAFADGINSIPTDNVEPLVSVLEDQNLKLREDIVTDGKCRQKILQNAALLEEEYFVAPPGNIPVNLKTEKS